MEIETIKSEVGMSWEIKNLGDLVSISKGKKHFPVDNGSNRYINIENLHNAANSLFTNEPGVFVEEKDLIIAWDGANAGKVGVGFSGVIGSTLARLKINNKETYPRFLFWFLESKNETIKAQRTGATIPHVNGNALKDLQIPLPPLPIQKRIAEILDAADALKRKDQQLLQKYDELAQAIFIDMFGDPVKNEKGWEVKKLGEIINNIIAGSSYNGDDRKIEDGELGVLKVSAVTSGYFRPEEYKAVKKNLLDKKIIKVKSGDFLFSRANTRELVGATCIADNDYDHLFLPDKLWKIDFDKQTCNPQFMKAVLSQKTVRYELNKTATGTSGSMLNISMEKLKELVIVLPPLEIQNEFGYFESKISQSKKFIEYEGGYSDNLFNSLIQKAFYGELVA